MNEAFICDGVRSPIGRYGGVLSSVRTDDLAAHPIREILRRNPGLSPEAVDEVILGCANQAGEDNRNVARMALLLAGLPAEVPGYTVNRLCASGLTALANAALAIRVGEADVVIAGGVESMSRAPFVMPKAGSAFDRNAEIYDTTIGWRFINKQIAKAYGTESMPETAENLARERGISRADQDAYALRSQQRTQESAEVRQQEIAPLRTGKPGQTVFVSEDEHPRPEATLESLAKLRPLQEGGTVTAGNASGVNDGSAALLIASAEAAKRFNLTPRARIVGSASAAVQPSVMGIGPVPATRKLLARTGMDLSQFGIIEINEAFAAQVLAVTRELGLPDDDPRVNPAGGAIALGHPLGMTGARLALAATLALQKSESRFALCTLCVGVGQGVSVILERA